MGAIFGAAQAGYAWIEIVGGVVSLSLIAWFFIELLRGRMSLRRLRDNGLL